MVKQIGKKIIVVMCIILLFFPANAVQAAVEKSRVQNTIASFAINTYEKSGTEFSYAIDFAKRDRAVLYDQRYDNHAKAGVFKNKLIVDCVGWANYCVQRSTGLQCVKEENIGVGVCFTSPQTPAGATKDFFEYIGGSETKLEPGDLICNNSPHVMVYVGDGKIVHMVSAYGLTYQPLSEYGKGFLRVWRIKDSACAQISMSDLNPNGALMATGKGGGSATDGKVDYEMADFFYNGIPDGKYSVSATVFERIIENLGAIADFIIGLITMIIRMVFVGWTAIIEKLLTVTITSVTGGENLESMPVTSTEIDSSGNITLEKIIFNRIGVFDVNFFNFNDEE